MAPPRRNPLLLLLACIVIIGLFVWIPGGETRTPTQTPKPTSPPTKMPTSRPHNHETDHKPKSSGLNPESDKPLQDMTLWKVKREAWMDGNADDYECVGWRQTAGCNPEGPRESGNDKKCDEIHLRVSGYCEIRNKITNETKRVMKTTCQHMHKGQKCDDFKDFLRFPETSKAYRHSPIPESLSNPTPGSRGIALIVYPRALSSAYAAVRNIRDTGCTLPIEIWHKKSELKADNPIVKEILQQSDVELREIDQDLSGTYTKPFVIFYTKFESLLFLDSDNFVASDPTYLFDTKEFKHFGAIFWPDYWPSPGGFGGWFHENLVAEMTGIEITQYKEQESGQILINRPKSVAALHYLMYLAKAPIMNDLAFGDKDLFRLAWSLSETPFHYIMDPAGSAGIADIAESRFCGMTMVQHDPNGRILFFHRNLKKWHTQFESDADSFFQDRLWTHIQQYKIGQPLEKYQQMQIGNGALKGYGCFGRFRDWAPYYNLVPLEETDFAELEPRIISYVSYSKRLMIPFPP